jgi:F-type H+-transporting ATPase subunit delta
VNPARPYAEALFAAAQGEGRAAEVAAELEAVVELLEREPDLQSFLSHPGVTAAAKRQVLREVFAPRVSRLALNFLQLVVDKRRFGQLGEMVREYRARVEAALGLGEARVQSARALDPSELEAVARAVSRWSGRQVRVTQEVRPELIGGLRVIFGDRILDASVAGHLARLRDVLRGEAV